MRCQAPEDGDIIILVNISFIVLGALLVSCGCYGTQFQIVMELIRVKVMNTFVLTTKTKSNKILSDQTE